MIDILIITYNESANLPACLSALKGWVNKVFVIDSGSTDDTPQLAQSLGATVIHHDWQGYARQKNWGLRNLPFESEWVLILDADEVVTPQVRSRVVQITSKPLSQVPENGFYLNRLTYFLGQPIRHCGYFPSWNLRLFKRGKAIYEDRQVHEHVIIDDPVGYIREPILHINQCGLEHYIAKHNRYSTLEAQAYFRHKHRKVTHAAQPNLTVSTQLNRWLKRHVTPRLPFPGFWRFIYMYVFRLGFLDGSAGLAFCRFICMYDFMFSLKLREMTPPTRQGLSNPSLPITDSTPGVLGQMPPAAPIPADTNNSCDSGLDHGDPQQTQPEPSPWSFREKLGRAIWMLLGQPLFRISFHNWHTYRSVLLRLFGARIGRGVAIRPTVSIEIPWMLHIDDHATIGDHAILYSLGTIYIGKRSVISQYSHLCAGTHDYTDPTFKLIRSRVTIGDDVWIGADAFIGPGVTVGRLSVVGARSSVYQDLPEKKVCVGNPARPIRDRTLRSQPHPSDAPV